MSELYSVLSGGVCAPGGFKANGIHCGIRKNKDKKDLALIYSVTPCAAAAVYTQNKVCGSPIIVTRKNISDGVAKAVICNSGNANTCNADGEQKAWAMCEATAAALGIAPEDVIVASTGVIGEVLDVTPIEKGMETLAKGLSEEGSTPAAEAIMTTDTKRKEIAVSFQIGDATCKLGAMAKGSGMIHPNMATMLSFMTTDVSITPPLLDEALHLAVADTFNMVSVDGDTSTNDMVSILASGLAGNKLIDKKDENFFAFVKALTYISVHLSRMIAADGEGATKLLECNVSGGPDVKTAKAIAKSVITSSLFKSAMFGEDANWGRILCAIGYADAEFDIHSIAVTLQSEKGLVQVCKNGAGIPFSEETAAEVLSAQEIKIQIDMGQGSAAATAWGCDLTYDYVKINGDYRT